MKNKNNNKKVIPSKPLEFGLRRKFTQDDMGLYYLAQRGSLLYEHLQKIPFAKKSSFDKEVQKLFIAVTNEIEKMIHSSKHLPLIMEEKKEKITWQIFDPEREYRIYHYLSKLNAHTIQDFDNQLDAITFKLWNSYHRYFKLTQKYFAGELLLFNKLEYVISWTRDDRKSPSKDPYKNSSTASTKRKKDKTDSKIRQIDLLIVFPILAAIYLINGFKSYHWWDIATGITFLVTAIINLYFKHSYYQSLIFYNSFGILFLVLGGHFITEHSRILGPLLIVLGVIFLVGVSFLHKKTR